MNAEEGSGRSRRAWRLPPWTFPRLLLLLLLYKSVLGLSLIGLNFFHTGNIAIPPLFYLNVCYITFFEIPILYIGFRGVFRQPPMLIAMPVDRKKRLRTLCWMVVVLWLGAVIPYVLTRHHTDIGVSPLLDWFRALILFAPLWGIVGILAFITYRSNRIEKAHPGYFRVPVGHREEEL